MVTKTSCVAAGDIFISRRLPAKRYEGFEDLRQLILQHEVRFANLEILFLEGDEGYPAYIPGTYAMGPPAAIEDVKSMGFNIFSTANNHQMDFSHKGLVSSLGHLRDHGILHAGTGINMGEAAAPVFFECSDARVGLVAACSTIDGYQPAGNQREDMLGRPGLNPLRFETRRYVSADQIEALKVIAKGTYVNSYHDTMVKAGFMVDPKGGYYFGGEYFFERDTPGVDTQVLEEDMERVLRSIREVRRQADFALVSIHAHEGLATDQTSPATFMRDFCHRCIDEGATAVIGHGSHVVRGVEMYGKGVIFYSLGNVLFENDTVRLQPADWFQKYSLPDNAYVGEGMDAREQSGAAARAASGSGPTAYNRGPGMYKTVLATWDMEDGGVNNVRLHPVELGNGLPRYRRGLPTLSKEEGILEYMNGLSGKFNTGIEIKDGVGYVKPL